MSGTYKVCFANVMSEQVEKIVMFSLHIGDKVFQDIAKQGPWSAGTKEREGPSSVAWATFWTRGV